MAALVASWPPASFVWCRPCRSASDLGVRSMRRPESGAGADMVVVVCVLEKPKSKPPYTRRGVSSELESCECRPG